MPCSGNFQSTFAQALCLLEFSMTANGICKFCRKSVTIPDNLQGSPLRCPFCLRDFDVFEPQGHPENVQSGFPQSQPPELQNLTHSVTEFLQIRATKKLATDSGCGFALLMAVILCGMLFSESWPYFLLTSSTAGILFCGAWIMLIDRYFARRVRNAFDMLFDESGIATPGNRELYMKLLADLSNRLKVSEEKIISDPFLRKILDQLADGIKK